ncbi:MAG: orotidine-5'-phosphate decarboxylase [Bacillota bacterium]|nr:orotidine-5'-phosphate decarboxylase [Bacillota bacterium]
MTTSKEALREQMKERLIVALDVASRREAFYFVRLLQEEAGAYKIGMQLYNSEGPDMVEYIQLYGGKVFVDLKFHDIPNTVAQTSRVMARRQAFMYTMHAGGGSKMLKASAEAVADEAAKLAIEKPLALGVTVLTSISQQEFHDELGLTVSIGEHVLHLAQMAKRSGLDGVVCSPHEIKAIREVCGEDFLIVTPGVRPAWAGSDDQQRIMTPGEAIRMGASYLVVGRPITKAEDPAAAARRIVDEMTEAAWESLK